MSNTLVFSESQTMFEKWISVETSELGMILLSTVCVYAAILFYTRVVGLRSFSKMSAADFAMTIATGSLFGSTISSPQPSLLMGLFAIACIFLGQWFVARLRLASGSFNQAVDNRPMLLMTRENVLHQNLRRANMTEADLFGKLREAGALNFDQVQAVVLETTGDVSVMRAEGNPKIEPVFFRDVIGAAQWLQTPESRGDAEVSEHALS